MKRLFTVFAAAACMAIFGASAARAQQQGQDQSQQLPAQNQGQQQTAPDEGAAKPQGPIPAYRSPLAGAAADEDEDTTTEIMPDNRAVTGVQTLGLGTTNEHSYWQPHLDVFVSEDSNPGQATGHSSWGTWASISGGVNAHKVSANNDFVLSYLGGGTFSTDNSVNNGAVQELAFSNTRTFHRWALTVIDALSYLPESGFGFGGLGVTLPGGGGSFGGGLPGPGQTLLVGRGQNLGNQFDTEADVFLTGRTSLTFAGGYSTLNYFDSDLLNYGTASVRAGYNYLINRKDTIGVDYTFSDTNYSNFHQSIVDHVFQVAYGRRVTGRLAFQIAGGPEIATFTIPINPGTGGEGGNGPTTKVYWSLNANLVYAMPRTSFGLGYSHGVTAGSGVLAGSQADTVSGSITRQMTRRFSSGVTGGYSRNNGLAVFNATPTGSQTFDYWFGGANLTYPLGRALAVSLAYQVQYQRSGTAFCIGATCSTDVLRNVISVGLNWRDRQRRF